MNLKRIKTLWAKYANIRIKTKVEQQDMQVMHDLLDVLPQLIAEMERLDMRVQMLEIEKDELRKAAKVLEAGSGGEFMYHCLGCNAVGPWEECECKVLNKED